MAAIEPDGPLPSRAGGQPPLEIADTVRYQAPALALQAYRELSLSLKDQRDWEGALLATDAALAICPGAADLCASRIDLLGRLQRDEEAARYLQADRKSVV